MSDLETLDIELEQPSIGGQTPTFLKVLCVISWIAAGLGFFGAIFGLFGGIQSKEDQIEALETAKYQMEDLVGEDSIWAQMSDTAIEQLDYAFMNSVLGLLVIGLSSFFVFMMFRLKKQGFYLYSALHIIMLILPLTYLTMNGFLALSIGINGFFTLLFIFLYGLNLKHMK